MDTYISLEYDHREPLPPGYENEVRTPEALVERLLVEYTEPGDSVIDVFAGFGTTLVVAERLDRVPHGLEYEPDLVTTIRERTDHPDNVRQGSVLDLEDDWFPACECCVTSPPFMTRSMERNPFENYAGESTYEGYLADVETAFARIRDVIAPGGRVIVDVANMKNRGTVTPLAWDVAERVSSSFRFEGEIVVTWEGNGLPDREGAFGYGYDHSYCLVFERSG